MVPFPIKQVGNFLRHFWDFFIDNHRFWQLQFLLSLPFFECDSAMATEKELDKPRIIRMDK